jgi:hypothetical protein
MKKLIRVRILAILCLFFRQWLSPGRRTIRRIQKLQTENKRLRDSLSKFFEQHPPETVNYFTLIIFQCWAVNECKIKSEVTDEAFAGFLDQINDLVRETYRFYAKQTHQIRATTDQHPPQSLDLS